MSNHHHDIHTPNGATVEQLLALDGEAFVDRAYRTLLGRAPDAGGRQHYLGLLGRADGKARVIADLHLSAEGQQYPVEMEGLDAFVTRYLAARAPMKSLLRMFRSRPAPARTGVASPALGAPERTPAPAPAPAAPVGATPAVVDSGRRGPTRATPRSQPVFWFDLTTSMEWTGGVVGIVRAELEIAWGLKKIDPNVRFSMQKGNGFVEIPDEQLAWLFDAPNVIDAYMKFFDRYQSGKAAGQPSTARSVQVDLPDPRALHHPYCAGDVVVSVGWMDSQKEAYFSKVKAAFPHIFVVYLIYDIILLRPETRHLYSEIGQNKFEGYIKWISETVDFTLFGGETAKKDTRALQAEMNWPSPPGEAVKFGSDIMKSTDSSQDAKLLEEVGITGPFIITVGSIEPRKNHDTLYRAYLMALAERPDDTPQLVICGRQLGQVADLVDSIDRDPRLAGKVLRLSPTDTQLAALYKHCRFTVLPSLYEGWSLTLPESLSQGKFCLSADTPPLREIGRDLIDYASPWDARSWADKILHYATDDAALHRYERRIAEDWTVTTWKDTAQAIHQHVKRFVATAVPTRREPEVWMDLTLTYLHWQGGVNGIIRAELTFARYLRELAPNTHFFAHDHGHMFEIPHDMLLWLFNDSDLTVAYKSFHDFWHKHEADGTGYRSPFRASNGASEGHPAIVHEFPDNSIVFFAGIEWEQKLMSAAARASRQGNAVVASQLIYDLTPLLVPHLHQPETCEGYHRFVEFASQNFDHIVYGGQTARRDGIAIQKQNGWKTPHSDYMEFGSDINVEHRGTSADDQAVLDRLGVGRDFIMTVGTIQPRKNHETLYKAYVTLYARGQTNLPKLVFIGKEGWKSTDFLTILRADARMKDRILLISPTDEELDVLYRHCRFTLLPSFYEGWSLTLPESLSYGKFCLTADVDPLRETGRDLVEYVDPLDTFAWADRIGYYITHPEAVAKRETHIRRDWKPRTWKQSTEMLLDALYEAHAEKVRANETRSATASTLTRSA
ncbi:glycosyltransferase WbpX [Burkholderia lata]|uniref:glycosyltransferase n=1 Tax=Burkholderia lata (strain ATCC 17760 / DSM 23089 / LMG 22485 / NCIMB 9086 / R18194 / 383) TaxID=482957 RepID=UPI001453AE0C|nr:glycosyltransferase [Burkholderia lata]VWD51052.1 glycosyltransferase WbpX [Burkholderia lata]